jgi:hypothetical protein
MERKLFAWWPVTVTSGERVWLNIFYEHKNLYDASTGRPPLSSLYFTWTETAAERMLRQLKGTVIQNRNVWNDPLLTREDRL